jgi:outer membrane lipoprotein-sorting protein
VKKSFFALLTLFVFALLFIDGCAPSKPVQIERAIAPDRLVKRLEANRRKIKSFSGTGSISIKTNEMSATSTFLVEIKKPDSAKISFFGPFGIDLAYAIVTPQNFQFYDVINNTLYHGKIRPGVMKEILKVNINFEDLINIATGAVNLTNQLSSEPNTAEAFDDLYRLTYIDSSSNKANIYYVKPDALEIREYQQNDRMGKKIIDANYSNFRKVEDIPVPEKVSLHDLENEQLIKIEYRTIEVNKEIGNLKLKIADDAKIIQW